MNKNQGNHQLLDEFIEELNNTRQQVSRLEESEKRCSVVEERLRKVNGALEVLSSCNHALSNGHDEKALLKSICNSIVNNGGYRYAWIGYIDDEDKRTIQPVASAGFDGKLLDSANLSLDASDNSGSRMGTAILKQKPCVTRNTGSETSPVAANEKNRLSYASAISLPLITNGESFGVLNVYSENNAAFDEEEQKLFVELAGELSIGILAKKAKIESDMIACELAESEMRFQSLVDTSSDGIVMCDENSRILNCNEQTAKLLGCVGVGDVKGRNLLDFITNDDLMRASEDFRRVINMKSVRHIEYMIENGADRSFPVEISASLVVDGKDSSKAILAVLRDMSKLKETEAALQQSEEKYKLLFGNSTDLVIHFDKDGTIVNVNNHLLELGAIKKDQVIGKDIDSLSVLFDETSLKSMENDFKRIMHGEPPKVPFEVEARTGSKKPCYFKANSIKFTDFKGNGNGVLVILHDITDSKVIENDLRKSKEKIKAQYRGIPIPTYTWQKSGDDFVLTDFNDAAAKGSMGIAVDLIGSKATKAIDRVPGEIDSMNLCLEGKSVLTREMVFQGGDTDEARHLSINYAFVPPDTVLVHAEDITDRKEAENVIKTSNKRLHQILDGTVNALAITVEKKDPSTAGHQARVTQLATAIAEDMGMAEDRVEGVRVAGMLHDIGKISTPAEILSKPGRLTEIEMSVVRTHAQESYDILRTIDFPWPVAEIALQHHERMNGTGYPFGITGEEIIIEARILAVADVVEAMISHRPYRPSLEPTKALDELRRNRGVLYDLQVVDVCYRLFREKGFVFQQTGEPISEDPDVRS